MDAILYELVTSLEEFSSKNNDRCGTVSDFSILDLRKFNENFGGRMSDLELLENGSTIISNSDSTNIINPELAIITNISLDHTNLLGDTIEKIANEKAGIIKNATPIIIGRIQKETTAIFKNIAKEKNATLIYARPQKGYASDLKGDYQKENINTCFGLIQSLSLLVC